EDECTGQAHTAHTCEPVPFIYVGKRPASIRAGGVLADVASTLLTLMGLPVPAELTGKTIVELQYPGVIREAPVGIGRRAFFLRHTAGILGPPSLQVPHRPCSAPSPSYSSPASA